MRLDFRYGTTFHHYIPSYYIQAGYYCLSPAAKQDFELTFSSPVMRKYSGLEFGILLGLPCHGGLHQTVHIHLTSFGRYAA